MQKLSSKKFFSVVNHGYAEYSAAMPVGFGSTA